MKPVFEIIPEAIFFQQTNLICEISLTTFSYIFENDVEKKFYGLSVFHFEKQKDISEQLKNIFQQESLLSKNYKKVFVSFSGDESVLLPEELYDTDQNTLLLNRLFGDLNEGKIFTDLIADKRIYNVYRIPAAIYKVIVDQFALAAISHQYSLLIKQEFNNNNLLKIIFYKNSFVLTFIKAGELQIIQAYSYLSVTDVVYHLKNICNQFNLTNIPLHIGGLIEVDSDLTKELRHYFTNITFDELPTEFKFAAPLKEVPAHYFSHLFLLASCV